VKEVETEFFHQPDLVQIQEPLDFLGLSYE
jgi:hypothetical protein